MFDIINHIIAICTQQIHFNRDIELFMTLYAHKPILSPTNTNDFWLLEYAILKQPTGNQFSEHQISHADEIAVYLFGIVFNKIFHSLI